MSDKRSPEEIEGAISQRQEELAEDLEDLEYRLSRRGIKDETRERLSSAAEGLAERASSLKDQAAERATSLKDETVDRAQRLSSRAERTLSDSGRRAAEGAKRNRPMVAVAAAVLAIGVGIYFARRSGRRKQHELRYGRDAYAYVGPSVPSRSFQYSDFGDY